MAVKNKAKSLPPEEQFTQDKKEAMDPEASKDFVQLGTKQVQIRLLHYSREERVVGLVSDALATVTKIDKSASSIADLVILVKDELYRILPEITATIFEPQGITREWIESEESGVGSMQMFDALMAQLEKNQLADRLGKLLTSGALESAAKLMNLNT